MTVSNKTNAVEKARRTECISTFADSLSSFTPLRFVRALSLKRETGMLHCAIAPFRMTIRFCNQSVQNCPTPLVKFVLPSDSWLLTPDSLPCLPGATPAKEEGLMGKGLSFVPCPTAQIDLDYQGVIPAGGVEIGLGGSAKALG
jgi:hypothetical protein